MIDLSAKRLAQAQAVHGDEKRQAWIKNRAALHIVGKRNGATAKLAEMEAVSQSAVRRWAAAARTYDLISAEYRAWKGWGSSIHPRWIRDVLTPEHFTEAGELMGRHDLIIKEVYDILLAAALERMPVRIMVDQEDSDQGAADLDHTWGRALNKMYDLALELRDDHYGIPEEIRQACIQFIKTYHKLSL